MTPETLTVSPDKEKLTQALAPLAVALSAICFGFLGLFARRFESQQVAVPHMLAIRFLGGAALLWVLCLATGQLRRVDRRSLLQAALLGSLYVGEAWCYFTSAKLIPVALTALLLYLYPAMVTGYEWAWLKVPQRPLSVVALLLSFSGVVLCVGFPHGTVQALGVLLGVATAVIYTLYLLVGARVQVEVGALQESAMLMTVSGALFAGVAAFQFSWTETLMRVRMSDVLAMVLVGTVLPIPLLLFALTKVSAARASVLSTLEPVTALLVSVVLLGDALTRWQVLGAGCIVAAVVMLSLYNVKVAR
jgi:drug/metabolite transporter (DMT)-like permease